MPWAGVGAAQGATTGTMRGEIVPSVFWVMQAGARVR